jgi:hypothetical protein
MRCKYCKESCFKKHLNEPEENIFNLLKNDEFKLELLGFRKDEVKNGVN